MSPRSTAKTAQQSPNGKRSNSASKKSAPPKKGRAAPPSSGRQGPPTSGAPTIPSAYEIQTAVLHLIELAAGAEGLGNDGAFVPGKASHYLRSRGRKEPSVAETFERDAACLASVVKLLLDHRGEQRRLQRNAYLESLLYALTERYREYQANDEYTPQQLELGILGLRDYIGAVPTDAELLALTPDEEVIRQDGGPAEAAKHAIVKAVGLSEGTVARIKREPWPLHVLRRPFGRYVGRKARAQYVAEIHESLLDETGGAATYAWGDLREVGERTGRILDRRGEALAIRELSDPSAVQAMVADRLEAITPEVQAKQVEYRVELLKILQRCADATRGPELPPELEELLNDRLVQAPGAEPEEVIDDEVMRALETASGDPPDPVQVLALRNRFAEALAIAELVRRAGLPRWLHYFARRALDATPPGTEIEFLDDATEAAVGDAAGSAVFFAIKEGLEEMAREQLDPPPERHFKT